MKNKGKINILDFVAVGPEKTGTTWIYHYLKDLEVCFPLKVKETFFFDKFYNKGLNWYIRHFKHCQAQYKKGEVAPTYFDVPEAPGRLYQINHEIKIIITLRDPYERTKSLYFHELKYGKAKGPFQKSVKVRPHILNSSYYATHVQRWLKTFGKKRVLILLYEQLKEDPANFMRQICDFIDVPYKEKNDLFQQVINPSEMSRSYLLAKLSSKLSLWLLSHHLYSLVSFGKRLELRKFIYSGKALPNEFSNEDYQLMRDHFEPEIDRLESILNLNLSSWKRKVL